MVVVPLTSLNCEKNKSACKKQKTYFQREVLQIAIKAPKVIGSETSGIIADLPTSFLLPFRAQIIISFFSTHNFSGTLAFTLTISSRCSLPSLIFEDRNTIGPLGDTSAGEYVKPIYEREMSRILAHSHPCGISNGISSSMHFTSPVARNFS